MNSIGLKIKQIRKSKGISQQLVAETAGITQSSFALIESGKTQSIAIEVGKGIANALRVPFNELFDIKPEDSTNSHQKEFKFSVLVNLIQSELSHASLLLELSANEKLDEKERLSYRMQKENIQNGLFTTFKAFKETGVIDNEEIKKLIDVYPGFGMWQNFVAPLRELITKEQK